VLVEYEVFIGMAPKGKQDKAGASKGKGKGDTDDKTGKVKGAQQINVRHILVQQPKVDGTFT
jgi:NIMA-interacting peptidyl-prolyl cis-trans isomerase 4